MRVPWNPADPVLAQLSASFPQHLLQPGEDGRVPADVLLYALTLRVLGNNLPMSAGDCTSLWREVSPVFSRVVDKASQLLALKQLNPLDLPVTTFSVLDRRYVVWVTDDGAKCYDISQHVPQQGPLAAPPLLSCLVTIDNVLWTFRELFRTGVSHADSAASAVE